MKTVQDPICAVAVFAALLLSSAVTLAADTTPANAPAPSKAVREKMAQMHEKMAGCLRSERAVMECRQEMMQSCRSTLAEQDCGMMGGMMMRNRGMPEAHGGEVQHKP